MLLDSFKRGGSRMSAAATTQSDLLAELAHDRRFRSTLDRCRLRRDRVTIKLGWRFTEEDYAMFADGACAHGRPL